jgi:hypothetical protein
VPTTCPKLTPCYFRRASRCRDRWTRVRSSCSGRVFERAGEMPTCLPGSVRAHMAIRSDRVTSPQGPLGRWGRPTLRTGAIDADAWRLTREVEAMALVTVPTPEVLWHHDNVLALSEVRGSPLGRPGAVDDRPWLQRG